MGVAGAGKSLVGRGLGRAIDAEFYDADDFHSAEAVAKMRSGQPLDDADRAPWLDRLASLVGCLARADRSAVLACSALKSGYRDVLSASGIAAGQAPRFVYLRVTPALAEARVRARPGHYMPSSLIRSQFATLEEPDDAVTIDGGLPLDAAIAAIRRALCLDAPMMGGPPSLPRPVS